MADAELQQLLAQSPELTDLARQALEDEIARRNLEFSDAAPDNSTEGTALIDDMEAQDVRARDIEIQDNQPQGLLTVRHFQDVPEALLAQCALNSAGVNCLLVDENMVRMDWFLSNLLGGIKLQVKPEDFEEARTILSAPMPEAFDVEGVGSYEQPHCPRCHSLEIIDQTGLDKRFALPVLFAVGVPIPVVRKSWRCQSCEQEWLDDGPAGPSGP